MAHGMRATGQGASFLRLWGIYNNKYMLLVHVPLAMANSLSSSLIPSLSAASSREDTKEMVEKTSLVIRVAMLIAIPAAVGLAVLAGPVMNLLFRSGRNADGIRMLTVGSAAVVFLSLSTVTNAVLQGLGHMREPVKNAFISLVLHIGVLAVLLFVFRMGIYSMVFASIFFAIAMCVLNQRSIRKHIPYRQEIRKTFLLPAAASAVMGIAALVVYYGVHRIIPSNLFGVVVSVACAVFAYMAVFLRLGGITEAELHSVRGGTRLLVLAKKTSSYVTEFRQKGKGYGQTHGEESRGRHRRRRLRYDGCDYGSPCRCFGDAPGAHRPGGKKDPVHGKREVQLYQPIYGCLLLPIRCAGFSHAGD
jgi:stage V sporulation protein B